MSHLRGELAPGASFFGVVSSRERKGKSSLELATSLARELIEPAQPRPISLAGVESGHRIDGLVDMEEGLSADGIERVAIVVVALREELVVLTVRSDPADDVTEVVERLVGSFGLVEVSASS